MNLPQLHINQSSAQIGIKQSLSTIQLRQPMADLQLRQPQPEIKISRTDSKLEIDQTEAFADANLKSPIRVANEWIAKAKQTALQSIAKKVKEGDRLMQIENQKESVIPQIGKEKSIGTVQQFGLGYMPSSPFQVKFDYTPSELRLDANVQKAEVNAKINEPMIKINPGNVDVYVKQKNTIQIQVDQEI